MRDDLVERFPLIAGVIDLKSEPARKLIEAFAYRELRSLPIRLTPIPTRSSVWYGCPGP